MCVRGMFGEVFVAVFFFGTTLLLRGVEVQPDIFVFARQIRLYARGVWGSLCCWSVLGFLYCMEGEVIVSVLAYLRDNFVEKSSVSFHRSLL